MLLWDALVDAGEAGGSVDEYEGAAKPMRPITTLVTHVRRLTNKPLDRSILGRVTLYARTMSDHLTVGCGGLDGKGVYAARDFAAGDVVVSYQLQSLTPAEYDALPAGEELPYQHVG